MPTEIVTDDSDSGLIDVRRELDQVPIQGDLEIEQAFTIFLVVAALWVFDAAKGGRLGVPREDDRRLSWVACRGGPTHCVGARGVETIGSGVPMWHFDRKHS